MRTHTEGLLHQFPTVTACLCGVAGTHSDHIMSSVLSFDSEDSEELPPTCIHDRFGEMVVLHHVGDLKVFDGNTLIAFSIRFGNFEMMISALALDLQVRLGGIARGFAVAFAVLLAPAHLSLLVPERFLRGAIVARVRNRVPFAIGQEGLESDIDANSRVLARRAGMLVVGFGLTDNECIPMAVSPTHEVSGFGRAFKWTMEFDLDGAAQLLGERQMLPIRGKREISLVLSQLDRVPAIGFLEARETALLTEFSHGKEAFEGLIQTICQHLNRGSRHMLTPTTSELGGQIVFHEKLTRLLIRRFGGSQHLIVEMARLDQAPHEGFGLGFIRVDSVLKRSHSR